LQTKIQMTQLLKKNKSVACQDISQHHLNWKHQLLNHHQPHQSSANWCHVVIKITRICLDKPRCTCRGARKLNKQWASVTLCKMKSKQTSYLDIYRIFIDHWLNTSSVQSPPVKLILNQLIKIKQKNIDWNSTTKPVRLVEAIPTI